MSSSLSNDFPELSHLSSVQSFPHIQGEQPKIIDIFRREDLEDLLSDPVYFQAMFHSLGYVKDLYRSQSELGMANEAIAQNNMALQQRLYDLRAETKDAFEEAKALEARWKELEKEQKEVYQRFTPQFLLMRLRHSITAQDDASEALASSFIQQQPNPPSNELTTTGTPRNGRDVDAFVKEFKELRKVYHKRVMWGEKWSNGQVIWRDN